MTEEENRRIAPGSVLEGAGLRIRNPKQAGQKRDVFAARKDFMDEAGTPPAPSRFRRILKRGGFILLLCVAVSLAYLFLLLGEPDREGEPVAAVQEERIIVPMAPVEEAGNADLFAIAGLFGKPILNLYAGALPLAKAALYDTAVGGGYARRVVLSYSFLDGETIRLESIRPTAAAILLEHEGASLQAQSIFSLAGMNAARMDSAELICIFTQSAEVVYAAYCPQSHAAELGTLLKQTTLLEPSGFIP